MLKYAAVADDLTGATTVGVLLARSGIPTAALFSSDSVVRFNYKTFQAICISTDSRSLSPEDAFHQVVSVTSKLKELGVEFFSKRIDTTLRGGIGTEIDAMLSVLEEGCIGIVVPSMPQSKRIVVGGYSIIDGIPLSMTSVSSDVKTPVNESFVPDLIKAQSKRKVGLISLKSLLLGKERVKEEIMHSIREGNEILVCDAVSLNDIEILAEAVLEIPNNVLAVDPGPFTAALAAKREKKQPLLADGSPPILVRNTYKTVIVVAGSATENTRIQIQNLREAGNSESVMINPFDVIGDEITRNREKSKVKLDLESKLSDKTELKSLILESSNGINLNLNDKDQEFGYEPGKCSSLINEAMADIAASVLEKFGEERIAGFYTTGGDTMLSLCKRLGVEAIEMVDYVIPQADIGRFIGNYEGLTIVGKGGLTGSQNTACLIVDRILAESV